MNWRPKPAHHSAPQGGLIAPEMERRLTDAGEKVAPLISIDSILPYGSWPPAARLGAWDKLFPLYLRSNSWRDALRFHLFCIPRLIGRAMPQQWRAWTRSVADTDDDPLQLDAVRVMEESFLGAPQASMAERIARVVPANIAACLDYRACPYDGDVCLLQSTSANPHLINAWLWQQLVRNLEVRKLPGDHQTILRENVASLAHVIADLLRSALSAAIRQP